MSYEGRYIFICPKGHISQSDVYFDEKPIKCDCGELLTEVGMVDDTNGNADASFYKKEIVKPSYEKKYDSETDSIIIHRKLGVYEIMRDGFRHNFDTGEKIK